LSMNIGVENHSDIGEFQQRNTARLDLNSRGDNNEGATTCKQLDLNSFSWN